MKLNLFSGDGVNDDLTMGEVWNALKEEKRRIKEELGIKCPVCKKKLPKACPTILVPGKTCKICKTTYAMAKKGLMK